MTAVTGEVSNGAKAMTPERIAAGEIHARLVRLEDRLAAFCPPGMTPQMVLHSVMVALQQNPKLLEANPNSVAMSAVVITQWGLQIGQTAYIIPYKGVATPVADYKGYIELMMATGLVKHVNAKEIREGDHFEYEEGDNPIIVHRPTWQNKHGKIIGAYCSIPTRAGGVIQEVMNLEEIEHIRASSHQWNPNKVAVVPYWYARKCPIRRAAKSAPKSARLQLLTNFEDDAGNPSEEALDTLTSGDPLRAIGAGAGAGAPSYDSQRSAPPVQQTQGYGADALGDFDL